MLRLHNVTDIGSQDCASLIKTIKEIVSRLQLSIPGSPNDKAVTFGKQHLMPADINRAPGCGFLSRVRLNTGDNFLLPRTKQIDHE